MSRYAGHDAELVAARSAAFAELERVVRAVQADGWALGAAHDDAVVTAWSSVHGLATLWLDGGLPPHLARRPLEDLAHAVAALVGTLDAGAPA